MRAHDWQRPGSPGGTLAAADRARRRADALVVMRGKPIDIELLFDRLPAAWVQGNIWHESQRVVKLKDGRLRMFMRVADTGELVGWILHFGSGVRVIQPESLREKVREEARKIVQQD